MVQGNLRVSDPLFLARFDRVRIGGIVEVTGDEARHAVVVKRTTPGEGVLLADGAGRAVRGRVVAAERNRLAVEVTEILESHPRAHRFVVAQALAKGDRSELAVEIMTELGVDEILAWQASRSIVRWQGERGVKSLGRWTATAREATKQSRRFRIPDVSASPPPGCGADRSSRTRPGPARVGREDPVPCEAPRSGRDPADRGP